MGKRYSKEERSFIASLMSDNASVSYITQEVNYIYNSDRTLAAIAIQVNRMRAAQKLSKGKLAVVYTAPPKYSKLILEVPTDKLESISKLFFDVLIKIPDATLTFGGSDD